MTAELVITGILDVVRVGRALTPDILGRHRCPDHHLLLLGRHRGRILAFGRGAACRCAEGAEGSERVVVNNLEACRLSHEATRARARRSGRGGR